MNGKILLDNEIKEISINPGYYPSKITIDGNKYDNLYFDSDFVSMFDGTINFKIDSRKIQGEYFNRLELIPDDVRYNKLKDIHSFCVWEDLERLNKIPIEERLETILFGLKYFYIESVYEAYTFTGLELTYKDFCISYNKERLVVFRSSHNGYLSADYLSLTKKDDEELFNKLFEAIKKSFIQYSMFD